MIIKNRDHKFPKSVNYADYNTIQIELHFVKFVNCLISLLIIVDFYEFSDEYGNIGTTTQKLTIFNTNVYLPDS